MPPVEFDLNDTWRTGLDIQRVTDQSYLLEFGYGNPLLNAEISPRLPRRLRAARLSTSVDTYAFQPLLPGIGNSTQPIVLPVINQNWQSQPDALGGRWNLNANLLDIIREVGTQTRRLSLGSQWERDFSDGIGGQYKFTASLRGDGYWVNNLSASSNPDLPSAFFSRERDAAARADRDQFCHRPRLPAGWAANGAIRWSTPAAA